MSEARERRRLLALYDETRNFNFLRAAVCLDRGGDMLDKADILMAPDQKTRGQPEITDHDALFEMAILMERDGLSRWGAALKVASESPGHSETSTAKRLDRKFRENPDEFLWLARELASARQRERMVSKVLLGAQARRRLFDLFTRSAEKFHSILRK